MTNYSFTGDLPETSTHLKRAAITKTIKFFELSGTIEYDVNACGPDTKVMILGEGNATHLGRYTVLNTYCVNSDGIPVSPVYGFITAANGDEIHTMLIGSSYNSDLDLFYLQYLVLDGTGRFEGVTGTISMFGTMDAQNLVWTLEGEATINFHGC